MILSRVIVSGAKQLFVEIRDNLWIELIAPSGEARPRGNHVDGRLLVRVPNFFN